MIPQNIRLWLTALILLVLAACGGANAAEPVPRLALRVEEDGIYSLTSSDLNPFGWDLAKLDAGEIRLTRGDQPASFQLLGAGKNRELRFFGEVEPTRFYNHSVYYLSLENGGQTLAARAVEPLQQQNEASTASQHTVRFEDDTNYQTQVQGADPWLGQRIFAPAELTIPLAIPNPAQEEATLTIQFWSASEATAEPDHHLTFQLNGQPLGEDSWDGKGVHQSELKIPAGMLQPGENTLLITAPGDTEARAELAYIDWVEISYNRLLHAEQDVLDFTSEARAYEISGFSAEDVALWDVTDAALPIQLTGFNTEKVDGAYQVSFDDEQPDAQRYYAVAEAALLSPPSIEPAPDPLAIPPDGADYIVIAHPSLVQAVQPLVGYREEQGLRTVVVTTEQIYQRFSQGLPTAQALTDFLRWAHDEWPSPAPRFVLLAGDASYDPLGYTAGPYQNLVPTGLRDTQEMGETASDNALADLNGDGLPDLAIGRFPAQTPEEMQAMVAKTLAYEQEAPAGDWRQQMLLVADDDDSYFGQFNQDMASHIPDDFKTTQMVIGDGEDVRADLLQSLNDGERLVSYMGHGAVNIWAQEEILTNDDIADLDQEGRLPFVVVWACLSGFFHHPSIESLGETLLLTPDKGAVAVLVPTGQTFPTNQRVLADALFGRYLFQAPTIGEALNAALRELNPQHAGERDIINTFVLLGDPALRIFD